ncbi:hypothetical protein GQ53DRAFT_545244 [Thozetella sp. PMI_491]|nr:hypothetical protein GQ53DRAFT_545244 [Thozetella sp. PMI_491]
MAETAAKDGGKGASKRWAAEKDWERHRATITQLYITENKTLMQVMEVMKKEYDFSATARMYKARFERWHLWKNERAVILSPPDSTGSSDDSENREVLKRWATEEDWENQRATITQLYVKENRTLAKLMEIMEDEHKFHATPKMYKSRFKRWGLWKNTRAADVVEIIRQKQQRDASQQPGEYYLNGKQVDIGKVEAYLKRRRKQLDASLMHLRIGENNTMVWRTPSPDIFLSCPSPNYLQSPTTIKIGEDMFKAFRDYYEGQMSRGRWAFGPDTSAALVNAEGSQGNRILMNFFQRFKSALPMLEDPVRDGAEGMKMLRICFAELPEVVQAEDPMMLYCILSLIRRIQSYPRSKFLLQELLNQLDAAASGLERDFPHPTRQLWKAIRDGLQAGDSYRPESAAPIIVDVLKRHLGAYHAKTIEWFCLMTFMMDLTQEGKEARLRSLCDAMDNLGLFDERHMGVRMNLIALIRKDPEKLEDAAQLALEVIDDPVRYSELLKHPDTAYNYLSLLAEIRQSQGDLAESERLQRECLKVARAKLEVNESDLLHALRELEEVLRVQGKYDEAEVIAEERKLALKESLERVGEEEGA